MLVTVIFIIKATVKQSVSDRKFLSILSDADTSKSTDFRFRLIDTSVVNTYWKNFYNVPVLLTRKPYCLPNDGLIDQWLP